MNIIYFIVIFVAVYIFFGKSFKEMFDCVRDMKFDTMTCSMDLYAFGGKLYLVDRRIIYSDTNPRIFSNYGDYMVYATANKCEIVDQKDIKTTQKYPKSLDYIDDPSESYLRQCNKKVAAYMAKQGDSYDDHDHDKVSEKTYSSMLNYRYDNDVEKCMVDMILAEHASQ